MLPCVFNSPEIPAFDHPYLYSHCALTQLLRSHLVRFRAPHNHCGSHSRSINFLAVFIGVDVVLSRRRFAGV
jgi:hypothetical protein